jgi:putative serine protease PepD
MTDAPAGPTSPIEPDPTPADLTPTAPAPSYYSSAAPTPPASAQPNSASTNPAQYPSAPPTQLTDPHQPNSQQRDAWPADSQQPGTPPRRRPGVGVVVAAVAVAALVGGVSGAGIGILSYSGSHPTSSNSSTPGSSSVTVNDSKNATTITAVAVNASPSVVTINVTGTDAAGTGSGIILSADGYVLTNTHVVTLDGETGSAKIKVETNDGRLLDAKVVGTDPVDDLAVIKIQNVSGLKPATWADSSKLNVGDTAIAIGAPLGLAGTVTNGIISALNRSITVASSAAPSTGGDSSGGGSGNGQNGPFDFWNFGTTPNQGGSTQNTASSTISLSVIQTDAAINPGNSGGALLDSDGRVIGVNCAIASAGQSSSSSGQSGSIGVGFAIPSNVAQRIANDLIKSGKATHGLLGASIEDVTADSKQANATSVGASIQSVVSGGAAASAGLRAGDIITNFNGFPITGGTDLTAQVRALPAGAKADVTYVRDGRSAKTSVTLGKLS